MPLSRLSTQESALVREALYAAADGPFFPDWEFQTLFGLRRDTVRRIANEWPLPNVPPNEVENAVIGSLNMLLGYPHCKIHLLSEWISADRSELEALLKRLPR